MRYEIGKNAYAPDHRGTLLGRLRWEVDRLRAFLMVRRFASAVSAYRTAAIRLGESGYLGDKSDEFLTSAFGRADGQDADEEWEGVGEEVRRFGSGSDVSPSEVGERSLTSPGGQGSLVSPTDLSTIPPLEFVVGAPFHIARGTVTTLFGLGGVGKSSLSVALAASIALGKPFLGAEVQKGRVFYGEFEGAGQLLARTTRKVIAAMEEDHPEAALVLERDFKQKHFTPVEKAAWGYATGMIPELIRQLGREYDVIVFDSYEAAAMSDSLDPQVTTGTMMLLARLATETNTAVIVIDHAPKHNRLSVYGSTKKTDFARVVINIDTEDGSGGRSLRLTSTKCNVAPTPVFPAIDRVETETTLRFVPATGFRVNLSPAALRQNARLEELVLAARSNGAVSRNAVYEYVQIELGLESLDAARKRVKRAGLDHVLPPLQHGHGS